MSISVWIPVGLWSTERDTLGRTVETKGDSEGYSGIPESVSNRS